jgi:hypothetical protein
MLSISSPDFAIQFEPEGLQELSHRVYYSDTLSGYLEEFQGDLTFYGADYTYLRRRFFSDGCAVVPIVLQDGCGLRLTANIFMNDATWRPDICKVTCQLVDDSFLSLIDNNKGIKAFINVPRSKNDVPITAVTQTDLVFSAYDTVNNAPTGANRRGVRVYDALRMLVEFMSDGLIGFESDFFFPDDSQAVNRPRIPTLLTGRAIRTGATDSFPFISFEQLYKDLNRLYNLSFSMERTSSGVIMRIEPKSYFRDSTPVYTIAEVSEIEQSSDSTTFYSKVTFGTAKQDEFVFYPGGASPPSLPFVGWSQEEYHLGGQCNSDSVLEIKLETLITDTNVIMRCLPFGGSNPQSIVTPPDPSYDLDIFIVLFDSTNTTIVSIHPIGPDLRYYNGRLTNVDVSQRWGDGIPLPIFLFLDGITNNDARGEVVTDAPVDVGAGSSVPFALNQWMNDNNWFTVFSAVMEFPSRTPPNGYDPQTNMADGVLTTGFDSTWYEAPNTGIYTIQTELIYDGDMRGFIIIQLRAGVLVQTSVEFFNEPDVVPFVNRMAKGTMTVAAAAGDRFYVVCFLAGATAYPPPAPVFPPVLKRGSYMEVFADGNQITQTYDPRENYLINSKFNYPFPSMDWQTFLNSRNGLLTVTHGGGEVRGFLKDANRKLTDGSTDWIIRSTFGNS